MESRIFTVPSKAHTRLVNLAAHEEERMTWYLMGILSVLFFKPPPYHVAPMLCYNNLTSHLCVEVWIYKVNLEDKTFISVPHVIIC